MEFSMHAAMRDNATAQIGDVLSDVFDDIGKELSRDYGGTMQHLWIDFELIERHAELRPPFPFRFQKKVGGSKDRLTGLFNPVHENVGHYSVRPDFKKLLRLPLESVPSYALSLIYESTSVLVEKEKKLGGFDAERFRSDFLSVCTERRFKIVDPNGPGPKFGRLIGFVWKLFYGMRN